MCVGIEENCLLPLALDVPNTFKFLHICRHRIQQFLKRNSFNAAKIQFQELFDIDAYYLVCSGLDIPSNCNNNLIELKDSASKGLLRLIICHTFHVKRGNQFRNFNCFVKACLLLFTGIHHPS